MRDVVFGRARACASYVTKMGWERVCVRVSERGRERESKRERR